MPKQEFNPTIARYNYSLSKTMYAGDATIVLPPTILVKKKGFIKDISIGKTVVYEGQFGKTIIENAAPPAAPSEDIADIIRLSLNDVHDLIQHKTQTLLKYLQPRYFILEEGSQYDDYQIIEKIGEGAFSKVYKVINSFKNNYFVFKVLSYYERKPFSKANFLKRFKFEFNIGQINSEYILQSYQKGFINGNPYIVSEYADGGDLNTIILDNLSLPIVNKIALDVLKGLKILHQKGIIHRDIKPANIFLVNQTFKLGDFGVSCYLNENNFKENPSMVGTNGFMAPELIHSSASKPISIKNDIFSFGCTMFQIITGGILPFGILKEKVDVNNYNYNAKNGIFRSLRNFRKDIPVYWEDIILRCLQPNPNERYNSIAEIIEELSAFSTEDKIQTSNEFKESKYDYDLFFSFAETDKLLAIEIYSFLSNKGLKIKMSNQLFEDTFVNTTKQKQYIHKQCKHLLVLFKEHNQTTLKDHLKLFQNQRNKNSQKIIIYNAIIDNSSKPKFEEDFFVVRAKKDILNALGIGDLFVNRHFESTITDNNFEEDTRKQMKNEILKYVAYNKLKKAIKIFYDYLEKLKNREEVMESLLLISSRYRRFETNKIQGTVSFDNLNMEENKIILSLNQLVLDYFQ